MISLGWLADGILELYSWLIIIRVFVEMANTFDWLRIDWSQPLFKFLYRSTELLMAPIRRLLPSPAGMAIDFSPLIAILIIQVVETLLLPLLFH